MLTSRCPVSIQAITWALEDAPDVPPHLVSVLLGLANHADRNGRGSYPSQETLADYARKSPRQAKRDLDDLQERGLIRPGDQRFVLHVRPDRRPIVWDLALERVKSRDDTHVTPPKPNGMTSTPPRGDTQGSNGVTPTSPEPKEEPTPKPKNLSDAGASAAPHLEGLPGLNLPPTSKSKPKRAKTPAPTRAHEIVKAWIDAFITTGVQPTDRQCGAASRTAKELLLAGNDFDRVLAAARSAGARGYPTIDREMQTKVNGTAARNGHRPYTDTRSDTDYQGALR
jgi:hypothetical protein